MPPTEADTSAAAWHWREGQSAEAETRWRDAVAAYEAALSALAGGTDVAEEVDEALLLTSLGRCYWNLSEARTAWRTLRRAISLYQQRGDAAGQAGATLEILRIWGPPERHREMAEAALEAIGDREPYLRARLLLRLQWFDDEPNDKFEQAMALGDAHGFADITSARIEREAWIAAEEGRIDEAVEALLSAHEEHARIRSYDIAAGILRRVGFMLAEAGELDRGYEYAERAFDYASSVHLLFSAQLPLMDMAGILYARGEFEACEALLARSPGESDFRGDLYRMWMVEDRGDADGALRLMVSPDRGGNATTAMGQLHAAAAGVLFRAGRIDAAQQAMRAWADVPRGWEEDICEEVTALRECVLGLADDALLRRIHAAFRMRAERMKAPQRFSTLQGRAFAPIRGGLALKLGLLDEAERHYREGLEWCERERLPRDAQQCRDGLRELAATAGAR